MPRVTSVTCCQTAPKLTIGWCRLLAEPGPGWSDHSHSQSYGRQIGLIEGRPCGFATCA